METEYIDLLDLQQILQGGVEELFPDKIWVKAEIASLSHKAGGHCYLDLCQNGSKGQIVAKAKAAIWRSYWGAVSLYFKEATGSELAVGMEILARVSVSYSELYGLTLSIDQIEPQFTLGAAELKRQQTIETLSREGLMDRQKESLKAPELPRFLSIISSPTAAGYGDFCRHIESNDYGYAFHLELFEAQMQGADAPESICKALEKAVATRPDAILILRGGGSTLDLACFDDYHLAKCIALCPVPVYTAIGHDRDYHVSDMVSFDFVKTPTAIADFFVETLMLRETALEELRRRIREALGTRLLKMESALDTLLQRIHSADPRKLLARGYTLVTDSAGLVLKSVKPLSEGDIVNIIFEDGSLTARIEKRTDGTI